MRPEAVCTQVVDLRRMYIPHLQYSEVNFRNPFCLTGITTETKHCHGLVLSFSNSCIGSPFILQTGVAYTPTHWKQCCLLFPKPVPISKNENLEGFFSMSRNVDNPRAFDIVVELHTCRLDLTLRYNLQ